MRVGEPYKGSFWRGLHALNPRAPGKLYTPELERSLLSGGVLGSPGVWPGQANALGVIPARAAKDTQVGLTP